MHKIILCFGLSLFLFGCFTPDTGIGSKIWADQRYKEIEEKGRQEAEEKQRYIENPNLNPKIANAIRNQKLVLGMNKQQVIYSLGYPQDFNKTVTVRGESEQWIFRHISTYVYFENGIVTAWQE